jgi:hypothetical protein
MKPNRHARAAAVALLAVMSACSTDDLLSPASTPSLRSQPGGGGQTFHKYYVNSSTGSDRNTGGASTSAWQTISKVSSEWTHGRFVAGDSIFFTGTFTGRLLITSASKGTLTSPIVLVGPATIRPGNSEHGIEITNTHGIVIKQLDVTAGGASVHTTECVLLYEGDGQVHAGAQLLNMRVSGCGSHAIWIGSYSASTLTDVVIDGLDVSASVSGLTLQGDRRTAIQRLTIRNTDSHDNPGKTGMTWVTGNGIQVGYVTDGLVERSRAWNNGANNDYANGGPVGIWAYQATRVTLRYNEVYGMKTKKWDGGGFDLDGGAQDCIVEYNYSHNNQGSGYLAYQYSGADAWARNIFRYNLSEKDGMGLDEGGSIRLGSSGTSLGQAWIYGNTVYVDHSGTYPGSALHIRASFGATIAVHNNVFIAKNGARLIRGISGTSLTIRGNNYYTGGGTFTIAWPTGTYATLAAFQTATGKESGSGTTMDPALAAPGTGGTLPGRIVGTSPAAYKLQSASTMPGAGIDMRAAGVPLPTKDFYGIALPTTGAVMEVGAASKY